MRLLSNECFCRNGGTCYTNSNSETICQCPNGFTGPFCELLICTFDETKEENQNE